MSKQRMIGMPKQRKNWRPSLLIRWRPLLLGWRPSSKPPGAALEELDGL